jgi:hypothetical protein
LVIIVGTAAQLAVIYGIIVALPVSHERVSILEA